MTVCVSPSGEGIVKHYRIKRTKTGRFYISENFPFSTLPELIVFYKQHSHGLLHCVL